jgi:hypothetical protein
VLSYRAYVGWITDVGSRAYFGPWPSLRLDEDLLRDYATSFALQARLGLDISIIWGLFVGREWPVDLSHAVSSQRRELATRLVDLAHHHSIRVLPGLGVYSWGFEEIIRANPRLGAGNPRALCPSNPETWEWQKRVTDWLFENSDVDGVSLQSADQGRCPCDQCARWGNLEYHARLNAQVTSYIKDRWPDKLVGVNTWGVSTEDPADLPHLVAMARRADFLIDVFGWAARRDPRHRRRAVDALSSISVAYGTNGGVCVRPPQHWQRYRWFIPTLRETARHLAQLHADGGRAAETFNRVLANPGDEVSLRVHATLFGEPTRPVESVLGDVLGELYGPRNQAARDGLAMLFLRAEQAFFDRWQPPRPGAPIYLERLSGDRPGEPQCVTEQMLADALLGYERELVTLRDEVDRLVPEVATNERLRLVGHCIDAMLGDVARALRVRGAA